MVANQQKIWARKVINNSSDKGRYQHRTSRLAGIQYKLVIKGGHAMASFFNHGTVIEGAYKGNYVFGLYENQLHLFDTSSVNSWKYNSGQIKPNAVIDSSTVKSVELLQEKEKGVDAADVGGAALLLGPIMGAAMYADGKKKLFYVNVQFNNGSQSLLKIESELYDIVQRISFELPKKSFTVENVSKTDIIEKKAKETSAVKQPEQPVQSNININPNNIEPTITRIELFLEDKEWNKAKAYAEAGLDYFPTDYRLYLYLLFADLKISDFDELGKCSTSFSDNPNYKKVIRFANEEVVKKLEEYSADAYEKSNNMSTYNNAVQMMNDGKYEEAFQHFSDLGNFKDSEEKALECKRNLDGIIERRKHIQNRKINREQKTNLISEIIEERKTIMRQYELEHNPNDHLLERIEELETQLFSQVGIARNQDDTYSFNDYTPMPRITENTEAYSSTNEWMAVGRTEDKILLLSKYSLLLRGCWVFAGTNQCEFLASDMFKQLNSGLQLAKTIAYPAMIDGFTQQHKKIIGTIGILSSEEIEKYIPDKNDRILKYSDEQINNIKQQLAKNNKKRGDLDYSKETLEWFLKDSIISKMVTIVNQDGEIKKVKNGKGLLPYFAAVRPAIWIDIDKLKPTVLSGAKIDNDYSDYERFEHAGFSFLFPKALIKEPKTIYDESLWFGNMDSYFKPSDFDIVGQGVSDNRIIHEETIELDTGRLHLLCWKSEENPQGQSHEYVEAYFKIPGDNIGLYASTHYIHSPYFSLYDSLKKGYLKMEKLEGPIVNTEGIINQVEDYINKRNYLLSSPGTDTINESKKEEIIQAIEIKLLEMAGIKIYNGYLRFTHYSQVKNHFPEMHGFNGNNEWMLIGRKDNKVLLLSRYSELDKTYYSNKKKCYWFGSELYKYLNVGDEELSLKPMLNSFSRAQIHIIGRIKLLSSKEIMSFLPDPKDRILYDKNMSAMPWFLSDDVENNEVTVVNTYGNIEKMTNHYSMIRGNYEAALRPALWIDLNKIKDIL